MREGLAHELALDIRREDLEWLANAIAETVVEKQGPQVIATIDVLDLLDLDLVASSVGGITDPLGQLRQWLEEQLKAVAEWIVNTVTGAIQTLCNGLFTFIESLSSVVTQGFSYISEVLSSIIDMITTVIIDPILQALNWVAETLPTLVNMFQQAIEIIEAAVSGIGAIVTETISMIIENVRASIQGLADTVISLVDTIVDTLSGLGATVSTIIATVIDTIQGLASTITSMLSGIVDTIVTVVGQVQSIIANVIDTVASTLQGFVNTVSSMVATLMETLSRLPGIVSDTITTIIDVITGASKTIVKMIQGIMDAVAQLPAMVSDVVDTILETISGITRVVGGVIDQIVFMVSQVGETISRFVSDVIDTISRLAMQVQDTMARIIDTITSQLANIIDAIRGVIGALVAQLEEMASTITGVVRQIVDTIAGIPTTLADAISKAASMVIETIENVGDAAIDWISRFIDSLKTVVELVIELPDHIAKTMKIIEDFIRNMSKLIPQVVGNVTEFVWEHLPDWVKRFLEEAPKALERVAVALTGFINAILKFPEWFPKWFHDYIAKPIADAIGSVATFFQTLMDLAARIVSEGPGFILDIAKRVGRASVDYVAGIIRFGFELLEMARDYVEEIAKRISDVLVEPIAELIESLFKAMRSGFKRIMGGDSIVAVYKDFFKAIVPYTISTVAFPELMRAVGEEVTRFTSMALQFAMQGGGAEGAPLIALANTIEKGAWGVVSQLPWSIAFWMAEPLRKPLEYATRYAMRNELPIEIPTLTMIRDMIRRSMATKEGPKVYEWIIQFAKLRGYSDAILELLYSLEKPVTKVMDRFGGIREIPLSLLWDVPTRSDLVRMLQRDVFASPMEWARFIIVHGLNEDLGKMYYMMSFEYPSFTQLWEFFVRGISGMLWYTAPDFIRAWFAKDAEWLGAGIPVDPKRLNYDYNALFKAIPFYMKWIQKSNFSWFRKGAKIQYGDLVIDIDFDWTADSWMLWDIAADLPGKIDARWMAKWALFDLISAKAGVGVPRPGQAIDAYPEVPFVDLVTQVVEDTMASHIYMDLRAFSRLLVANGLHPAWVPITAVAEAINALSEERTLLRTGFINLFKEGFWDYKTIDVLLDGFFIASFAVEYFDPTERKWKAGAINVPIKFLPGERRLLELRAAMDRALDILRDLVKELNRSYAEHIVITYEEYLAHLREGIDLTNEWFKPLIKELTGKELELGVDMAYWGAYAKVVEMYRELYTMRRIRYWIGRIITWSIYRLAAEYITVDDVKMIVGMFSQYGRLTKQEIEMLEKIMEVMVGIAKREYIPTPSQLATIAEVVPEAIKMMDVVFEKRHVPEEWRPIWARYIQVKPIVGDVRSLLTAYRRAKVYGVELGELEKTIIELAKAAGWTDRELQILALRIQVEELIEETRELRKAYLPTPMMLATLAEYVHVPIELVKKTLEARRVPEEWIEIWLRYIEVRPLADEARMLATVFFKAKRYGVPLGELEQQVLAILKELGFTKRELELRELRATIEAMIDQWREAQREYIPTPSMLATIAEVVPMARMLAEKVFEARNVPVEWRGIWLQYIQLRPIMDEVRRYVSIVLTMYEYFTIPRGELVKALDAVKAFGYEDIEIQFLIARADLERALRAYRELVGTPRQLVTMAEYSPTARRVALAEVYKMIDALPTDPQTKEFLKKMWEEYIRVRPVYDEVRRYVTELINDYANGVITREQLASELEELKDWGLDDYEIQFYMWLAEKRRMRYAARRGR